MTLRRHFIEVYFATGKSTVAHVYSVVISLFTSCLTTADTLAKKLVWVWLLVPESSQKNVFTVKTYMLENVLFFTDVDTHQTVA